MEFAHNKSLNQIFVNYLRLGWGKIKHPGSAHNILQEAQIPPVTNSECAKKLAASPGIIFYLVFYFISGIRVGVNCSLLQR